MAANAIDAVSASLQERHYEQLSKILDACELESSNPHVLEDWPCALHLLGHIYNQNLNDARFLWKRIPASVKQNNPELEAVWRLLQFAWSRQYQGLWQALQGYQWSTQLQPLIESLVIKMREHLLDLISTAYATVTPAKIALLCGMTQAETLSTCRLLGWQIDDSTGMCKVLPKNTEGKKLDSAANLQQMTEYMIHLEQ
ncbi:hypothetical protein CEUSTIGMA_g1302.t1 [Chlamydomonas eustigma]|uniref:CSN8/PSMD8/EIF3K domain-containing protein n=1 Tax=Chlamydomonas eustigma TaxID=1157962 RepID=A0A250WT66_9CHLO|nr:hypothetical protein CEUSTIGMA_g1302.t1 [Chlamydomonas eustigma]|eukprot:GAX73852.1 hypothetical protein CEUSTIGMA_g1302.t1 [Chlamydomonas eustigma]